MPNIYHGFICPVSARVNSRSLINTIVSAILPSGPEPRHLVVSGVNVKCFCCRRMVSEERWTSGEHRRQCAINKSVRMNLNLQVLYRSVARLSKLKRRTFSLYILSENTTSEVCPTWRYYALTATGTSSGCGRGGETNKLHSCSLILPPVQVAKPRSKMIF